MSASTINVNNSRGQSIDTIWTPAGEKRVKVAVGSITISGDSEVASWQGVATHEDGATFAAGDGAVLGAGVDGTTLRHLITDSLGRLLAVATPTQGNLTDRSGTVTAGGTHQQLAAANTLRKYLMVQNLDGTEDLWINFGADAEIATAGSIQVVAKAIFVMEGAFVSTQAVSVNATTTAHKFTAKEG